MWIFHKTFKNSCFVEPIQRFASEIAKFQVNSSAFIKESVVFNCLTIKNKAWYFLIHPPLISFKIMLTKQIFNYHTISEKNQTGGVEHMEFQRVLKKHAEIPESIKKEVEFLGVVKKVMWIFHWSQIFGLEISKGCSTNLWNLQGGKLAFYR